MKELAPKYNPAEVEEKWYSFWESNGLFNSDPDAREPYTIVIPPPNVTGILHMGHMLNNTIQDILVRRARQQGKNALWVPGTDHASISTETKVIQKLKNEGIKKTDLTREQFLEHAWEWTHKHGGIILQQLRKLGASCDWRRTAFTMDDVRSESVIKVFCDLYDKGLLYRGLRMVNWDPENRTAISDDEVYFEAENSKLYYLKYLCRQRRLLGRNRRRGRSGASRRRRSPLRRCGHYPPRDNHGRHRHVHQSQGPEKRVAQRQARDCASCWPRNPRNRGPICRNRLRYGLPQSDTRPRQERLRSWQGA